MATVASPPRPVGAAPPTVRHGTCRLTLRIGGTEYRLRPMPAPPGFKSVWTLRKLDPGGEVTYSVAAPKGAQPGCTCPDHEFNTSVCKHIMALAALGLILRPKAARPVKARTRQLHRPAVDPLPVEAHRHLAEIAGPIPEGWQLGGAGKAALATAPPVGSFAAGFRQAVAAHVGRIGRGGYEICEGCGAEFDPETSNHPEFCFECAKEGEA